ncbi:MAG: MGH1-like glycoside hydrolase domain-containing protein [Thermomicrobiales bacterium]
MPGSHEPTERFPDPERQRLAAGRANKVRWDLWGPYLAERQWGTVREDYSPTGDAWTHCSHDQSRSRTYRWGEDGLLGISDSQARLCFALALWNGNDPILKERLFGLTGPEGNHGEDVKEIYFYLDATPTHSYLKGLYKYPQREFPYADLVAQSRRRSRDEPEYEILDTGGFAEDRYFDVFVEYAKAAPSDILIRISATNRGPDPAALHLLPTLWFRNEWAWGSFGDRPCPLLRAIPPSPGSTGEGGRGVRDFRLIHATHDRLGDYWLACAGEPALLITENETNAERLWNTPNRSPYVKDGINDAVVHGRAEAVNPDGEGTKAAAHYIMTLAPGGTETILLRLSAATDGQPPVEPFANAEEIFAARGAEADAFYAPLATGLDAEGQLIQRQAYAGLIWSKQFYYFDVGQWLDGDPAGPRPPASRKHGRNAGWRHLNNADVLSMPDTWEYPWYAAWDLAFHCVPLARIDPGFAKRQLVLLLREWYMHPNGQIPAYEWTFDDVNPPVIAWAAWRVYQIDAAVTGKKDRAFLERVFHKLMMNFTWWVNRKDHEGRNVFQGGFLGLDNIGVFDRSKPLPTGGYLEQADGTAWMGMFSLQLMTIALELARDNRVYEDVATKYFEHFLYIAGAMNDIRGEGIELWDEEDGFFYDVLQHPHGGMTGLKVRSLVGLIPLLAVETLEPDLLEALPGFNRRLGWFLTNRPHLASLVSRWQEPGSGERRLLALVRANRMKHLLRRMLDEREFLSPYGIRSLSRRHADEPFVFPIEGEVHTVHYEPAESQTALFGGNSNWRGPIWFPLNYLLIEALREFHRYYGDGFLIEHPTGSGNHLPLDRIADELASRLVSIFRRGPDGRRPFCQENELQQSHPHWRDYLLFHEYFHGDTGAGLGASHQTGWTALVATLLEASGGRMIDSSLAVGGPDNAGVAPTGDSPIRS